MNDVDAWLLLLLLLLKLVLLVPLPVREAVPASKVEPPPLLAMETEKEGDNDLRPRVLPPPAFIGGKKGAVEEEAKSVELLLLPMPLPLLLDGGEDGRGIAEGRCLTFFFKISNEVNGHLVISVGGAKDKQYASCWMMMGVKEVNTPLRSRAAMLLLLLLGSSVSV